MKKLMIFLKGMHYVWWLTGVMHRITVTHGMTRRQVQKILEIDPIQAHFYYLYKSGIDPREAADFVMFAFGVSRVEAVYVRG